MFRQKLIILLIPFLFICLTNVDAQSSRIKENEHINDSIENKVPLLNLKTINLTCFLQGLYKSGGKMNKAQNVNGAEYLGTTADIVILELHNPVNGALEYSILMGLDTSGLILNAAMPGSFNENYYIYVKHRNSILTSTAYPVSFAGTSITYNFSNAGSKAYGNNMTQMPDGKWVLFGADVNQDGLVDTGDMIPIDNLSASFATGYIPEDVNGDGLIDSGDMVIADNNATNFVSSVLPPLIPTSCDTSSVTYGGQVYHPVQIGTQCWLKENLNFGTRINSSQNQTNNGLVEKYCYQNIESNCDMYGGLYQWDEMMQYVTTPGAKGICPNGWHIPTDGEWCTLTNYLDFTMNCLFTGFSGTDAGTKMKSSTGWSQNGNGTNVSGLTALPAGYLQSYGDFADIGVANYLWSSSYDVSTSSWHYVLVSNSNQVVRASFFRTEGDSVRCIKD